jgi:hypothetical protein
VGDRVLRALERCGDARASAEDAGIDHTTAYARRKAHADFGAAWAAALAAHKARREREESVKDRASSTRSISPSAHGWMPVTGPPTSATAAFRRRVDARALEAASHEQTKAAACAR